MGEKPSPDTLAALMLLLPVRGAGEGVKPLDGREFRDLASWLRRKGSRLASLREGRDDLVEGAAKELRLGLPRLRALLDRHFEVATEVERWASRAIWVAGIDDPGYPSRWRERLGHRAPLLAWGVGPSALLDAGGLAIVGSRDAGPETLAHAQRTGMDCAGAGIPVVSGGARGVDRSAMLGALEAGGKAVGVLPCALWQAAIRADWRPHLAAENLVLVSPWPPQVSFQAWRAMQRNRLVYALADAALVVETGLERGGTWSGAVEQLEKLRLVPVYARKPARPSAGITALLRRGARAWPAPSGPAALESWYRDMLRSRSAGAAGDGARATLPLPLEGTGEAERREGRGTGRTSPAQHAGDTPGLVIGAGKDGRSRAERLRDQLASLALELVDDRGSVTKEDLARDLDIPVKMARRCLEGLVSEGMLEKETRPVRYRRTRQRGLYR